MYKGEQQSHSFKERQQLGITLITHLFASSVDCTILQMIIELDSMLRFTKNHSLGQFFFHYHVISFIGIRNHVHSSLNWEYF